MLNSVKEVSVLVNSNGANVIYAVTVRFLNDFMSTTSAASISTITVWIPSFTGFICTVVSSLWPGCTFGLR